MNSPDPGTSTKGGLDHGTRKCGLKISNRPVASGRRARPWPPRPWPRRPLGRTLGRPDGRPAALGRRRCSAPTSSVDRAAAADAGRGYAGATYAPPSSTCSPPADEPINGYQVIQQIADRTDGVWKPSPGSVYPTIAQLQDEGLVEDAPTGRKAIQLTAEGRAYVEDHPEEMAAVWAPFAEQVDDDEAVNFKQVIGQTVGAIVQVATTGTPDQRAEGHRDPRRHPPPPLRPAGRGAGRHRGRVARGGVMDHAAHQ